MFTHCYVLIFIKSSWTTPWRNENCL